MIYGKNAQRVSLALALGVTILLVGCGGGGLGNTLQTGPPITITLSVGAATMTPGQQITIKATVYDQSNQGAIWTVSPLGFGSLSNQTLTSVDYTAPIDFSTPTTVTIIATSITNPNVTAAAQLNVSPVAVSLATDTTFVPVARTINQGEQLNIFSNLSNDQSGNGVTWTLSPASGTGSLAGVQAFSVTYVAPGVVQSPTTVTVTAASVTNPSATSSLKITVLPSGADLNVAAITVDGGPVAGQTYANGAFTSVTICKPGSQTVCQTVDGVLVDTGSAGLRILQSQLPVFKLPTISDVKGNILENCDSMPDGSYLWGPVSLADVYISGETTALNPIAVPIQVISSSNAAVPMGCSNGSTANDNTPQLLGANGILGVGPEPTDCTVGGMNLCDRSVQPVAPNVYYACPSQGGCTTVDSPIFVTKSQQVSNPVPLFSSDNNGVVLQLPAVSSVEANITGTMIFGIGTRANNDLGGATVFTLDANDNFTTVFGGQNLTGSFIDSGSTALFFPDSLPICTNSTQFFCPPSLVTGLSATNQGATQGMGTVSFSADNADNLFSANPGFAVFGSLAGPAATNHSCAAAASSCVFDWGLPFFYGRRVYTAIQGQPVSGAPPTPWWAY